MDLENIDLGILGNYGVLGLFATLLIVYFRNSFASIKKQAEEYVKREVSRSDYAERQLKELQDYINTQFLQTIIKSNEVQSQTTERLQDVVDLIRRKEASGGSD